MKTVFTCALLSISFVAFSQINVGLVAYYPLDGNIKVVDALGDEYVQGLNQDYDRSNQLCSGELSKYNNLRISFNTNTTSQRSLSFWVKRQKVGSDYLFESGSLPLISISTDSIKIDLFKYDGTGKTMLLKTNDWYHIVWTFNNSVNKIFVNGILLQQKTIQTTFSQKNSALLGGAISCSMDDISIYEKELSMTEITELYNLPSSCITTSIFEDQIIESENKKVVFASDILGSEINDPSSFPGIMIMYYSDGSRKK